MATEIYEFIKLLALAAGAVLDLARAIAIAYIVLKAAAWAYINLPPLSVFW